LHFAGVHHIAVALSSKFLAMGDEVSQFSYDRSDIHLCYDQSRLLPPETMRLWMETIATHVPPNAVQTILDLGCGTGRFVEPLADHFAARIVGIDLEFGQNGLT
jgi:ubiquinone/menaquinone biosynthesis C-methylase UbiE